MFGANGVSSGGEAWNVSVINGGSLRIASGDFTIRNLRLEGIANNLGTLRLSEFQFGNNGHLISSGTLQTDRSKLFSIEDSHIDGLNVVDLGQTQPQEVREQLTEFSASTFQRIREFWTRSSTTLNSQAAKSLSLTLISQKRNVMI